MFRQVVLALVLGVLGLTLGACTQAPLTLPVPTVSEVSMEVDASPTVEVKEQKFEVFHWWTAAGEADAAEAMFSVFQDRYPDLEIVENPVAGGGGVSHRVVLEARLEAGIPPDTFQTLGGAELKSYVEGGYLVPLDDLYAELGYGAVIPRPLKNAVTINRHPYVVPLNMHIQNILYYDKEIFDALDLEPPLTYDALLMAASVIQDAYPEMYPLSLGTSEKWEAAFLFDSILLETGGPKYYVNLYKGNVDVVADPIFSDALSKMEALIPYIYPAHHNLTWDESCGLVTSGDSAMVLMGTWGIGYFLGQGWEPDVDFSAVTFPQQPERILLFHPDTYGLATGASHPETTLDWLETVASPELQITTDVIQGGLFARIDIDPEAFPDPVRQELQAYISENPEKLILDQHGSIAPLDFTQTYWELIAAFLDNPDVEGTTREVADQLVLHAVKSGASWYVWP